VLIIGDFTARVGDPSGRSATRPMISGEEIDAHARTYAEQAGKVLRTDERLEMRYNREWLDMPIEDLFRLARVPTVAQLLEREDFARRMAANEPVSLLEVLYPVLQGYDSVAVEADVELGGTDQTFNLLMGRAIQTAYGHAPQVVLTLPILPGTDGVQKMSKSFGNQIGIAEPPAEMYGKTLSVPDSALGEYYDLLLGTAPPEGRDAARRQARPGPRARGAVPRGRGRRGGRGGFDRVFVARELPEEIEEAEVGRQRRRAPARADRRRCSAARARRRGGDRQGGVRARRRAGAPMLDLPAASSTAACCRSASAASGGCACA
jgi:tyrosyl-tRNA synthetase